MGKTFGDLRGKRHRVENFDGTDCDQDIHIFSLYQEDE